MKWGSLLRQQGIFKARGLRDNGKGLWGGWAFITGKEKIWFIGGGRYGKHFEEIGKRLGHFDPAFMECGQYNEPCHQIHMYPEESIQAAIDVNAKQAKFSERKTRASQHTPEGCVIINWNFTFSRQIMMVAVYVTAANAIVNL